MPKLEYESHNFNLFGQIKIFCNEMFWLDREIKNI